MRFSAVRSCGITLNVPFFECMFHYMEHVSPTGGSDLPWEETLADIERRTILKAAAISAAGLAMPSLAKAQAYPTRAIQYIVGFAPGGTSDTMARIINPLLAELLGQAVVVENLPGAGGVIAMEKLVGASADGYTLAHTSNSFLTVTPHLMQIPYDPLKDIEPVAQIGGSVQVLGVNPKLPVKTLDEFLKYAKANSGKMTYASSGVATGNHITIEYFKRAAGFDAKHIPYKGAGPAIQDVAAGRVDFTTDPALGPMIEAGKIRPIAVVDYKSHPIMKDLPAIADAVPNWKPPLWIQFVSAPKGTPPAVKQKISDALKTVLDRADIRERLAAMSVMVNFQAEPDLKKHLQAEYASMGDLLKAADIKM